SLQARLFSGTEEIGQHLLEVVATDELTVTSVLVHPHPVAGEAAFTFVLSEPGEVSVEIYTLAGRQVRSLAPQAVEAGFGRAVWDGRDGSGARVASGTYLYVLSARGADGARVVRRRPFVVLR
ncbi:MAG: FlgD immunoglobulin-like domain containing protein, partial [Planctomycetota bacterium]